jgi:ribosome-associated protein
MDIKSDVFNITTVSRFQDFVHLHHYVVCLFEMPHFVSHCRRSLSLSTLGVIDKQKSMLDFIEEPMETTVGDEPSDVPPERDELADLVRCIVRAADGRKADNIVAIRISKFSSLTSFVVILSGNSRPQNQAIAAAIKRDVADDFDLLPGSTGVPEGTADSGWMVLDYGSVMVHVMTPKSRLYYNVEGQWSENGEYMDMSDVLVPNAPVSVDKQSLDVPKEEDPFWS